MKRDDIDFKTLSENPGIYIFRGARKKILYVGRATDLRNRVRSYFSNKLAAHRGPRLIEALEKTKHIETIETDSVLDAYILEANLIKKYQPSYNVIDKDNKSFQFVCITDESFPRIMTVRGRSLEQGISGVSFSHVFGPFPRGAMLQEAMRVLRKILPYRDSCTPYDQKSKKNTRKCFRAELGLCPGMCAGLISKQDYNMKRIREIRLFFSGKKKQLLALLEKEMKQLARKQEFEQAELVRRRIFALTHIQDVALIKKEFAEGGSRSFRIEAYDIAHLAGTNTTGAMTVLIDGTKVFSEYRVFTIRTAGAGDDIAALRELLTRRLAHSEWRFPNLIVIDGGKAQLAAAQNVLGEHAMHIPVVSVVKTERHTPREILGAREYAHALEREIVLANAEAHRFALSKHRHKRSQELFK